MARFPKAEAEILALARKIIQGLRDAPDVFPHPPVSADELQAMLDDGEAALTRTVAAEAVLHEEHAQKDRILARMTPAMKAVLRYAETTTRRNPRELGRLGWGPPREPRRLEPPGEVRGIKIVAEGDTYIILQWSPPADGGAVAVYTVERKRNGKPWKDVDSCTATWRKLDKQPRGVELEFRVYGRNRAGRGKPSATVRAVL
jgi:hypothetical protein